MDFLRRRGYREAQAGVSVVSLRALVHDKKLDPDQGITPMSMSLAPNLPPDKQREMLRQMLTIRRFEGGASADYHAGKIYGVVHCYIGEEAVAVGVCSALDRGDRIISTHRGHGHCIAKGAT